MSSIPVARTTNPEYRHLKAVTPYGTWTRRLRTVLLVLLVLLAFLVFATGAAVAP